MIQVPLRKRRGPSGPEAFGAEVPMHVVATLGAGALVPGFRARGCEDGAFVCPCPEICSM